MLSAMTTSENFPLANPSECSRSPYESTTKPTYITNLPLKSAQMAREDDSIIRCRLFQGSTFHHEELPLHLQYCSQEDPEGEEETDLLDPTEELFYESGREKNNFLCKEVPRNKLESESPDSFEQVEAEDSSTFDQSKPLKIDPNVLKLDFSKLTSQVKRDCTLDKLCLTDFFEMKRSSHHLSGGGLLTNVSRENFRNSSNDSLKNRFCKLSGVGLIPTENVFNFENMVDFDLGFGGVTQFLNQISPSSPLTFDLMTPKEQGNAIISGISPEADTTNPFKNFAKCALKEGNAFPSTNPFNDCNSSSPNENPSIILVPPKYENISQNKTSFSQCSTLPVSPVSKAPEEPFISNPFLINETSPETGSPAAPQFTNSESRFANPPNSLPNPSSFILAVPVFPIFQHSITNSSTQTVDLSETPKAPEEPVYQNVSNQLSKFMKRNDHSEYDLQCLKSTVKDLRNSGWYYENVSWQESVALLADTEPGTFLIRDSSDPNFLFSLSVQTSRGPTSVRIHYVNGQFRLDAEEKLIPHMPSFNSVIELIDYYVENTVKNKPNSKTKSVKKTSKQKLQKSKDQVWIDAQGNIYSNILLVKPLYKRDHFSSLQHLARLIINRLIRKRLNTTVKVNFRVTPVYESSPFQDSSFQNNFDNFCPILNIDALPLPSKLLAYLKEYPFCH